MHECHIYSAIYLVVDHVRPLLPHGLDGLEDVHFSLHLDSLHLTHCSNEHTSAGHAVTDIVVDRGNSITFGPTESINISQASQLPMY